MVTTLGFEGEASPADRSPVPGGYGGLDWTNVDTIGTKWLDKHHYANDGFDHVMKGKIAGDALDMGGAVNARISDADIIGSQGTFTLKSGSFAAAFNTGETVTFDAYHGNKIVGTQIVTLDQTPHTISFNNHFKHITSIHITSDGGTDANPDDGGTGADIAFDNLKVLLDASPSAVGEPPHLSAHAFSVLHAHTDWALF